jgi:hypothetical protein
MPQDFNFLSKFIDVMTSRRAVDRAIFSASVIDKAINVSILDAQTRGQPVYLMIYPARDKAVEGSPA